MGRLSRPLPGPRGRADHPTSLRAAPGRAPREQPAGPLLLTAGRRLDPSIPIGFRVPDSWRDGAPPRSPPATPGNQPAEGEIALVDRFRKLANQRARAWALAAGRQTLDDLRPAAKFYEEVRVWMGKFDAQERQAQGRPIPEEIQRLPSGLVATSTETGDVVDIYEAAGMPKPSLSDLGPEFAAKTLQGREPAPGDRGVA